MCQFKENHQVKFSQISSVTPWWISRQLISSVFVPLSLPLSRLGGTRCRFTSSAHAPVKRKHLCLIIAFKPEDGSYSSLDRRVTQNIVDSSCWFCAFVLMCILYIDFLDLSLCFLRRFLLWVIGDWQAASSVWPKRRECFFLSSPLWICQSPCPCHRCCLTEEE